jgi:subtilisin-like proprotein convertase family protein
MQKRSRDTSPDGFKRWTFMTVQLWGEFPKGDWKLTVFSSDGSSGMFISF